MLYQNQMRPIYGAIGDFECIKANTSVSQGERRQVNGYQ